MRKVRVAEWMLSLVAERERAAALAGDLAEESLAHGGLWFILSVAASFFRLFFAGFRIGFRRLLGRSVIAWFLQNAAFLYGASLLTPLLYSAYRKTGVFHFAMWKAAPLLQLAIFVCASLGVGHWLARRSRGQELAVCVLATGVGYLLNNAIGTMTTVAMHSRTRDFNWWTALNAVCLLTAALAVRLYRMRVAHA